MVFVLAVAEILTYLHIFTRLAGYSITVQSKLSFSMVLTRTKEELIFLYSSLAYTQCDSRDGSTFNRDFLQIGNDVNQPSQKAAYFAKSVSDDNWINMPSELYDSAWIGYRQVFVPNKTHFLVVVTELLPIPGRIWSNYYRYDTETWNGWKHITPG